MGANCPGKGPILAINSPFSSSCASPHLAILAGDIRAPYTDLCRSWSLSFAILFLVLRFSEERKNQLGYCNYCFTSIAEESSQGLSDMRTIEGGRRDRRLMELVKSNLRFLLNNVVVSEPLFSASQRDSSFNSSTTVCTLLLKNAW
jgi:hypothetical protein